MATPYPADPGFPSEAPSKFNLWYPECGASQCVGLGLQLTEVEGLVGRGGRLSCQELRMRHSFIRKFKSCSVQGCKKIVSLILEWIVVKTSYQFLKDDLKIRRFHSFQICQRMKPSKSCQILLSMGD
jgi:hypothetical protein